MQKSYGQVFTAVTPLGRFTLLFVLVTSKTETESDGISKMLQVRAITPTGTRFSDNSLKGNYFEISSPEQEMRKKSPQWNTCSKKKTFQHTNQSNMKNDCFRYRYRSNQSVRFSFAQIKCNHRHSHIFYRSDPAEVHLDT